MPATTGWPGSMARRMAAAASIALVGLMSGGCDDHCAAHLRTRVTYAGAQLGVMHTREVFVETGFVLGATAGVLGPADSGVATSDSCWNEASPPNPAALHRLDAWVDLDGDDPLSCAELDACAPDAGEPQGQTTFTVKAMGLTEVELTFGDP